MCIVFDSYGVVYMKKQKVHIMGILVIMGEIFNLLGENQICTNNFEDDFLKSWE